jgi:hypothetical protein
MTTPPVAARDPQQENKPQLSTPRNRIMRITLATITINIVGEIADSERAGDDLNLDDVSDPAYAAADDLADKIKGAAKTLCEEHGFQTVCHDD